jgi:hypothetical protein
MAESKPDPTKTYAPIEPFATVDGTVLNPSAKLRGDDPVVAEHFALFIPADAPMARSRRRACGGTRRRNSRSFRTVRLHRRSACSESRGRRSRRASPCGRSTPSAKRGSGVDLITLGEVFDADSALVHEHPQDFVPASELERLAAERAGS